MSRASAPRDATNEVHPRDRRRPAVALSRLRGQSGRATRWKQMNRPWRLAGSLPRSWRRRARRIRPQPLQRMHRSRANGAPAHDRACTQVSQRRGPTPLRAPEQDSALIHSIPHAHHLGDGVARSRPLRHRSQTPKPSQGRRGRGSGSGSASNTPGTAQDIR